MYTFTEHGPVVELHELAVLLAAQHASCMQIRYICGTPSVVHRAPKGKHRDVPQSRMAVATHTADADVVVARLEVYNSIIIGVTDATRSLFRHKSVLDFVEDSAVMRRVTKFGGDRRSLDSLRRPLLPAPCDLCG